MILPGKSLPNIKKKQGFLLVLAAFAQILLSCEVKLPPVVEEAKAQLTYPIDYNLHVKPILSDKCYFCHGPDPAKRKAGLRLDIPENAFSVLKNSGNKAIVAGNLHNSELVHRIIADDEDFIMPPFESNVSLSDHEKAILIKWIEEGAAYKKHWAFEMPQHVMVPEINQKNNMANEIDHFIFSTLEKNQLLPQEEADKETLIRRVTFDLTGLPPTLLEIDDFLKDESVNSFEKVVDRLLASPHYGEKMAADWMDVSRFADTHGYSVDRYRPMWPWRDWVIQSFNKNQPYDEFVTWQLAGDLLPDPTKEQLLATAFNRNHSQNMEGGIVNEEYRIEYVVDRTNTFSKAFLAMTLECARCHDHKFDPISQKEYYQVFSFFNNVDEAGQISWDNATPVPTLLLSDKKKDSIIQFLDQQITAYEQQIINQKRANQNLAQSVAYGTKKFDLPDGLEQQLTGHFDFNNSSNNRFSNLILPNQKAFIVEPQSGKTDALKPVLSAGKERTGLLLNGDDPLTLGSIGVFNRSQPFSISLWVNLPENLEDGVVFHKGQGAILYNFRGYHLALRNNKFELMMAHTWPYNNIIKLSTAKVPKERWVHLTMTYDGSSRAHGLKLYQDGTIIKTTTEKDNLYKDILFPHLQKEPGLRFGARWRGKGTKGAVIDEIRVYSRELHEIEVGLLAEKFDRLNKIQQNVLVNNHSISNKQAKLQTLRADRNAVIESIPEIMVMDELSDKRKTFILKRGAYDAPADEVNPGVPASILSFPDSLPQNRLGLAKWLFSDKNPLTARVIVNRYWQNYFGVGLVKSPSDFGNQGALPSHPQLLDWLALNFRESNWNIKSLQKKIVMSASYRQSSQTSKSLLEKDFDNRLLSRGPSSRLTAEMLRDNALFASGLLVDKIGGESVKPYQPKGLWSIGGSKYKQDSGEDLYRRSLYTIWKRTVPPPSMNTFDAPTRSYCVVTRQKTSTPLQSLVLLNDPQFIEAYRALAARVYLETDNGEDRIQAIYRLLTSKKPTSEEMEVMKRFYKKQLEDFKTLPQKMKGWLQAGEFEAKKSINKEELASYTVLASMVMNADAAITKR